MFRYRKSKQKGLTEYDLSLVIKPPLNDEFLSVMRNIFKIARWFGIPTKGEVISIVWGAVLLCTLIALEVGAFWKLSRAISGTALDVISSGRSLVARVSGSIFYGNALISSILIWKFSWAWRKTTYYWLLTEKSTGLGLSPDLRLKRILKTVVYGVAICSVVEHSLSMMSATGFDIPASEYFEKYILTSHGFLLRKEEYTTELGIAIFLMSKTATCVWNFQDTIIILISIGLASRYKRLNNYVSHFTEIYTKQHIEKAIVDEYVRNQTWRKIREAYVRQGALVRRIDADVGGLVVLSNFNNFYFICLQLFLGLGSEKPLWINKIYFFTSLGWLCFRACCVVMFAAEVNEQSKKALKYLQKCPDVTTNVEVNRLEKQLIKDHIALSGKKFFDLDRRMLLKVAASILTYELVLLQYDTS